MEEMEATVRDIIRKVTLNPCVYWPHMYVTNAMDPDTRQHLFTGDLGDFLGFCVEWAMDHFYGVAPAFLTGRPSVYTQFWQQRAGQGHPLQGYPTSPYQGMIPMFNKRSETQCRKTNVHKEST
jgi:hypothetical protein